MRVLIIGKNSFIGSNFRKYSQYRDTVEVSLHDTPPESIDYTGFDVVLHLAAIVHQSEKKVAYDFFKVNRDLARDVAICAKKNGIHHFIFMSTIKVYGSLKDRGAPTTEDSFCFPENDYGLSKHEAEKELNKLADKDFIVSIIRTPLVYGEGVRANMLKLIRLIQNFPLLPFAKIENKRNFTFAENLVGYIDRIIQNMAGGVFIAMDVDPLSTTELVTILAEGLGKRPKIIRMPRFIVKIVQKIFPPQYEQLYCSVVLDNSKTREILDFTPPFTIEQGLRKMIHYYKTTDQMNSNNIN